MRQGFSLLELSIVLVIIGLITGGIMAGQSMVRAAELRSVMSDVSKYRTAVNTFKEKYNAYPGDMKNATQYWGVANATPATCETTVGTGTQTCDGDGDGALAKGINTTNSEVRRFWQHLANAGLIEGQYTGTGTAVVIGTNVPASKLNGAGFSVWEMGNAVYSDTQWFPIVGRVMTFGALGSAGAIAADPAITTADAYSFDSKIDDGLPASGWVQTFKKGGGWTPNCSSTAVASTATYDLTQTGKQCGLSFMLWGQ